MIWLLIGYMWLFIHRPFEIWSALATFRLERVYMIATILCWLVSSPKLPSRNRLHWCFLTFILVMLASWLLSPYQAAGQGTVENYLKYAVFYLLLVTSVRDIKQLRTILVGYLGVMTLYMLHSLREYSLGNVWYAQGVWRMKAVGVTFADYNDLAGLIVIALPFAWILWYESSAWWKRALLLGYVGMSGYCIVLTYSRMGAVGFVMMGGMAALASPKRWRLLALCPLLFIAVWAKLPEDSRQRYLTLTGQTAEAGAGTITSGRFRVGGFERGLTLLKQRPLLGIGPNGTGEALGTGMMPHNMYGQLLGELGLLGTVAFGMMSFAVFQNTFESRRVFRDLSDADAALARRTVTAMAGTYLLLLFMGWGFNFLLWHVWLWFGGFQVVAMNCLQQASQLSLEDEDPPEILYDSHSEKQPC